MIGFCSMGFVIDVKFSPYPDRKFTLLQEAWHIVEIACPGSVLAVPGNLFDQSKSRQVFNRRINGFFIHTAFLCDDSPWGKAGTIPAVAVPEQTAVDREISRLQFQFKDAVWNHKEVFVIHFILLSPVLIFNFDIIISIQLLSKLYVCFCGQNKKTRTYTGHSNTNRANTLLTPNFVLYPCMYEPWDSEWNEIN